MPNPPKASDEVRLIPHYSVMATKCRHFSGMQGNSCKAGVRFEDVKLDHDPIKYQYGHNGKPRGSVYSSSRSFPCLGKYNVGGATCEKRELYTKEEIAAQKADRERMKDLMSRGLTSCCEAPIDESRVIRSGAHKGHGPRFCSKCGKLAFIV